MIDPNHPLVEAARYTDAQGTEHGLEGFVAHAGMDMDTLMHIAKQRSLRVALVRSRGPEEMYRIASQSEAVDVRLSREEEAEMFAFLPAYMDGLMIGWEARRLADNN